MEEPGSEYEEFLPGQEPVRAEGAVSIAQSEADGVCLGGNGILGVGEGNLGGRGNLLAGVALVGLHGNGAHFQSGDVLPQVVPFLQLGGDEPQGVHGLQLCLGPGAGVAVGKGAGQAADQKRSQAEGG